MSFREIDEARRTAASLAKNRGKKRKGGSGSEPTEESGGYISERRTGRWTTEEMAYCDKLMACFGNGSLPVADSVKLNEFLGNMLKSKQSRLTKKMKNAKLSSKLYQRKAGCLDPVEAREASELEDCFFQSIQDLQERAEIKFHMQKEWREQFSQICAATGQPLDADAWLSSVEEMDRRASVARDAARMAKRKLMMGVALKTDSCNPDAGVFIEKTDAEMRMAASGGSIDGSDDKNIEDEMLSMLAEDRACYSSLDVNGKSSLLHSAPFLAKVTTYLQRHAVPFEHVDLWVPSFVGDGTEGSNPPACRLCFAGSSTAEKMIGDDGKTSRPLTGDELFNLYAFGDYSQKFSFDVGCGLPGRVYESGRPTWEQSVQNAPHKHFERCGGARQWKIKTVLGIPIASPNVGRIVVALYSCHDRPKDEDLVTRLSEEFTRVSCLSHVKMYRSTRCFSFFVFVCSSCHLQNGSWLSTSVMLIPMQLWLHLLRLPAPHFRSLAQTMLPMNSNSSTFIRLCCTTTRTQLISAFSQRPLCPFRLLIILLEERILVLMKLFLFSASLCHRIQLLQLLVISLPLCLSVFSFCASRDLWKTRIWSEQFWTHTLLTPLVEGIEPTFLLCLLAISCFSNSSSNNKTFF